jgi:hypothetical protein
MRIKGHTTRLVDEAMSKGNIGVQNNTGEDSEETGCPLPFFVPGLSCDRERETDITGCFVCDVPSLGFPKPDKRVKSRESPLPSYAVQHATNSGQNKASLGQTGAPAPASS